jgi:hypothetical protein
MNLGSFVYNVGMEYIKSLAPAQKDNQAVQIDGLKIKPIANPMKALDLSEKDAKKYEIKKEPSRESEIIEGFYAKIQMDNMFKEKKAV